MFDNKFECGLYSPHLDQIFSVHGAVLMQLVHPFSQLATEDFAIQFYGPKFKIYELPLGLLSNSNFGLLLIDNGIYVTTYMC